MTRGRRPLYLLVLLLGIASSASAQPETAPPPREKQPPGVPPLTVDYLVGQWKLVKGERGAVPGFVLIETYTPDGKRIAEKSFRGENRRSTGLYRLNGNVLDLNPDGGMAEDQQALFRVEVVDRDHMVLRGLGQFIGIVDTFQRLPNKK